MIKVASSFVLFAAAITYFVLGFGYSFYTADGRFGAGFFPRIVGGTLVVLTAVNLVNELRRRTRAEPNAYWRDIGVIVGLLFGFVIAMRIIGAVPGMFVFIIAVLSFLNRGRWVTNLAISVALPLFIHLLFRVWLNAALPVGLLSIPGLS